MRNARVCAAVAITVFAVLSPALGRAQPAPYPGRPMPNGPSPPPTYAAPGYAPPSYAPTSPAPPASPLPALPASTGSLINGSLALGAGGAVARQTVDLGGAEYRSISGGLFLFANGTGSIFGFGYRMRLAANVQGGSAGLETRVAGEVFYGLALPLARGFDVFLHVGTQGYGLSNDEVKASLLMLPALETGVLLNFEDVVIGLGPTAGLGLVTDYAPGDEDQGRRYRRKRTSDLGVGGFASVTWKHLVLGGSYTRILAKDPVSVVDGELCGLVSSVALCGFVQYWRSSAASAQPGVVGSPDALLAPTLFVGAAIGFGSAVASTR